MSEKTCKTVRLSFSAVLAVMTVIVGALFIWQVLELYLTGVAEGKVIIYTPEEVKLRVSRISPAFWLWIAMIFAGFIVWEVFPVKQKRKAWNDPRYALMRLKKRLPASAEGESAQSLDYIRRGDRLFKILWLCLGVLSLTGIIYSIVYLAIPSHFPKTNVTHEVLNMSANVFPWAIAVFACACGICVYEGIFAKRALPHAKKLAVGQKPAEKVYTGVYAKVMYVVRHKYFKPAVRIALGVVAVSFIIVGICNGNMSRILEKAVNICMECIGLG